MGMSVKLHTWADLTLGVISRYTSKVSLWVSQTWFGHFGEWTILLLLPKFKNVSPFIQPLVQPLYCLYPLHCDLLYIKGAQIFQKSRIRLRILGDRKVA
jgi:hypothetical protein